MNSVPSILTSLPKELMGFDLQSALLRVNGNEALLLKLLRDFYHEKKDVISTLMQMIEAKSYGEAAYLVHGLIGSIGNLGANQLVIYARKLEILFKNNQSDSTLVDLFAVEFEIIITSLGAISVDEESASNSTSGTADAPIDWDSAKSLSNILLKKLQMGDGNSMQSHSELENVLGESIPDNLTTIRKLVDDFEFDHAAIELQKLMDDLQK